MIIILLLIIIIIIIIIQESEIRNIKLTMVTLIKEISSYGKLFMSNPYTKI